MTLKENRSPDEVVITDVISSTSHDGSATPSGEPSDDFFSSWDKPSIKRPSNPPSRTQTPPVISRTASPFLNAVTNGNGNGRPKSPLTSADTEASESTPATSRAVPSSAIRKAPGIGGPRKSSVLGAKKTQKLGAKKVISGDTIDFEAAEKKAKEEAERIAKLGYDPDAEEDAAETPVKSTVEKTKIAAPTPISPPRAGLGSAQGHGRSPSEVERLGMGIGRLGFGQTGGNKAVTNAVPKKMGFGSVGSSKAAQEGRSLFAYSLISTSFPLSACYLISLCSSPSSSSITLTQPTL